MHQGRRQEAGKLRRITVAEGSRRLGSGGRSSIRNGTTATLTSDQPPYLGFGLGLRPRHYQAILESNPEVDWFEIISENYMVPGGKPMAMLERIRARYPLVMHGVSLSIASTAPLDMSYLHALRELVRRVEPRWISDHLCWTGVHGVNLHDLLPVPYTEEALDHVVERVKRVQDFLGRRIALENVSTYLEYQVSQMSEWEFVAELSRRADCWLLCDLNNIYVNEFNHGGSATSFLAALPPERVVQFHLAGHTYNETHLIDTHDADVCPEVWDIYAAALERFGPVSTMIERDDKIPPLNELLAELDTARAVARRALPEVFREAAE
jgi:uncharacterized protein (UPF0276 family)